MKPLKKKLLLWILCAGVAGSAQAIEPSAGLGTLSPAVKTQVADSGPFAGAGSMSLLPDTERPITVNAGAGPREGSRLTETPVPEPSEWMQLLCGLAFVAFVARRRTQPPTG